MKKFESSALVDSSIISEEIQDEVDLSGSGIPDEIGTISHGRSTTQKDGFASRSRSKAKSSVKQSAAFQEQSNTMGKFTNSFIAEES